MRARRTQVNDTALIVAARAGDRGALDELTRVHLPMVYNLARRALSEPPDVDDVVQDIMLRAVQQLPQLRAPESFRPWLTAIAVHQISTHLEREKLAARRTADLTEVAGTPDVGAEFEAASLLRVELSGQRRQVMDAGRWLAPEDRVLLPLWWLETVGELTRAEVSAAVGVSPAHAGVRLQRMRSQLDLSRSIVAALDAVPGCDRLDAVLADWDEVPSPFWRKRIARHTRSCVTCARAADDIVATDRLLAGLALLPVPAALTAVFIGKGALAGATAGLTSTAALSGGTGVSAGAGAKAWFLSRFVRAAGAHPVTAAVTAGALAVGVTVSTTGWSALPTPPPVVIIAPTPTPTPISALPTLKVGAASLESTNDRGHFVATAANAGVLATAGADSDRTVRRRATFEVVPGLADAGCFSLRTSDGQLLRHLSWRLRPSRNEKTALFRADATFCVRAGSTADSISLESSNYPGYFLRHVGNELWVDQFDGSPAFRADSSFLIRRPLLRE
ncbi:MAG TPA: sigma-70 family RNA polymerase sigma factor [Kineosporiaceae bacterium]|nr:sigma-70 family RNA polymerase sigma factor [Kineosporiaceae bacterium]